MADFIQTMNSFWNSFGVPAYNEGSVPDEQRSVYPRITYDVVIPSDAIYESAMSASIWDRDASWATAVSIMKQISDVIGKGGIVLPFDDGGMWIKKADPFSQTMGEDSDDAIRRIYLNISVELISNS